MILITRGLLATNCVRITALNVVEAAGTKDRARRDSLLKLERRLSNGFRPLEIPNKLLHIMAIAQANGDERATITIGEEQSGIWAVLNDPSALEEEDRHEALDWKDDLEREFRNAHGTARPHFQQLFNMDTSARPRSALH